MEAIMKQFVAFMFGLVYGMSILQVIYFPVAVSTKITNMLSFIAYLVVIFGSIGVFCSVMVYVMNHWDEK
jgi:hypothetical protein